MTKSEEIHVQHKNQEPMEMEAIVAAHETALLRYATGILRNPHTAQDVVQNVFIKLFRTWKPGMRPTKTIRNWLYRVTHNEAVDTLRRESRLRLLHKKHAREQSLTFAVSGNPGRKNSERMEFVLAHLGQLAMPEQQVTLLRLQEGLSYQEISRITGRTEGNVGCILHNAVKKLSRILKKEGLVANHREISENKKLEKRKVESKGT